MRTLRWPYKLIAFISSTLSEANWSNSLENG